MRWGLWPLLPILAGLAWTQEIDTASTRTKAVTIFDDIRNAAERSAFQQVWNAAGQLQRRQLALQFVEKYPQSAVLKDAYEILARSYLSTGDAANGIEWARRSLRLMPENPFLLAMVADVAARHKQPELAETSARDALKYLEFAVDPAQIPERNWPQARTELREACYFVLGRIAASRGQNQDAERMLTAALRLNPGDLEALYVLGVARMAAHRDEGAAPCFARVMAANGLLAPDARRLLRSIYDSGPHTATGFDEYAASLKWEPPAPERPAPKAKAAARYAGSEACRECHPREYESWRSTGMAKMFRPYRAGDVIGDFTATQTVSGSARVSTDGNKRIIEIRDGETDRWVRYTVDYIIGSKWQQAYATRLPGGELRVLPIQYSRLQSAWVNYWGIVDGAGSARGDPSKFHTGPPGTSYPADCAPCHTSQLRFDGPGAADYREGGVDCEMCHGPSLSHVESMRRGKDAAVRAAEDTPIDFRKISPDQYAAVCGQCHMQSAVHEAQPDGAVNFSRQVPFYRSYATHLLSDFSRQAFYKDGRFRATTFIMEAFTRSQCFRKGGATCGSCHDPHPPDAATNLTSLKFPKDSDQMCLQCHSSFGEHPERHTHHAAGAEASHCVSCHMPRIMDAVLFRARSHQIDDIPDAAMTERFGNADSPNACLLCHTDRDVAWLRNQSARLWPAH